MKTISNQSNLPPLLSARPTIADISLTQMIDGSKLARVAAVGKIVLVTFMYDVGAPN
jgi:hypothetical protein